MKEKQTVVIAGSGRSGTTWLGSLLDSYEGAEYFYEICHYPELDFDDSALLRVKFPLSYWMPLRPVWLCEFERKVLYKRIQYGICAESAQRSLRINQQRGFRKNHPNVNLFKIVLLFSFAMRTEELHKKFGSKLKVVHIIRNPFSQLASEIRQHAANPERAKLHFSRRMKQISENPRLCAYHELVRTLKEGSWLEQMVCLWWISNELMVEDNLLDSKLVVYERLCEQPKRELDRIFSFLGWSMSVQTEKHLKETTELNVSETGEWSIKKNAQKAISRWRNELEYDEYRTISELLSGCKLLNLWSQEELQYRQSPDSYIKAV